MAYYVRLLKGSNQAMLKGYDSAARGLREEALSMEFKDPGSLWWSVKYLVLLNPDDVEGSMPEALKRHARLEEMDPRWTMPRIEWAGWLAADNRLAEAIEKVRPAVRLEPTLGSHRAVLGYLLLRDRKVDEARKELAEAVRLGDTDAETRINLALAYALTGDECDKAASLLEEVLAEDPEKEAARRNLDDLRNAPLSLQPDLAHIAAPEKYGFMGILMMERAERRAAARDLAGAVRLMEAAVHYAPRAASIRANYASFLARSGAPLEEAVRQGELAVRIDPRMEAARRNLGKLSMGLAREQLSRGDRAAARATLRRALEVAPPDMQTSVLRMLRDIETP
jgi:Flp pilus assembly protein TadD